MEISLMLSDLGMRPAEAIETEARTANMVAMDFMLAVVAR